MIVLVACLCGACLLVGMVLGIFLERAANRRSRGGTVDLTVASWSPWYPNVTTAGVPQREKRDAGDAA